MENQILDDGLTPNEALLVPASKGKRFANFIIDYILFILLIIVVFMFLYGAGIIDIDDEGDAGLLGDLIGILMYPIYYSLLEGLLKGKSIGKFITGTRAVTIDGSTPSTRTIITRSLCRLIPFEAFSYLGSSPDGWHDRWSDTMVIDEKKSTVPNDIDLDLVK